MPKKMCERPYLIELTKKTDIRGSLVFAEGAADIPFEIKRVYYIFGTKENAVRGKHAHLSSNIVLICVAGSCVIRLIEKNGNTTEYTMSSPCRGLFIPACCWREMYGFSEDCVLLALSSSHYSENDYIRDYADFIRTGETQRGFDDGKDKAEQA